ncbi:hypothetical protein H696_00155 [Fonticula alba]|uniref:Uncharacterized protein n=1 Tax=Fonticula alba TaxID=691883 RepID=A0A058ZDX5_FONAL|nr:hypothetical protein H696_00155 [Fonticula alba]KCV72564.1 hypothetical protein H696_00155 [Fonticula alba]|eukprot:XP_009492265.1 hypothetical protein H696_00155 [Fonticula alba]
MARPGPLFQATGNELDMIDGFSDISSDEDNFGRRSMDSSPSAGLHNSATPPSTGGPPRLGLISRLPAPSSNGPHVVGRMVFDPVSMRWVRVSAARSASRISDTEADDEGAGEEDSTDEDEADIFDGLGFDEASLASGQTHDGSREKSLEDAFVVTHSMMAEWRAAERQYQRMVGHAAPGPSSSATLSGPSASSSSASLGPGQGPATSDPGASSSSSVPSSAGPWAGLAAIEPRSHFQMIRDIAARLV